MMPQTNVKSMHFVLRFLFIFIHFYHFVRRHITWHNVKFFCLKTLADVECARTHVCVCIKFFEGTKK